MMDKDNLDTFIENNKKKIDKLLFNKWDNRLDKDKGKKKKKKDKKRFDKKS